MNSSLKELKMMLRYSKRALRFINKMYTWKWIPIKQPLNLKCELERNVAFYSQKIKEYKDDNK